MFAGHEAAELDEDSDPGGPVCGHSAEYCAKYSSGRARTWGSLGARARGRDPELKGAGGSDGNCSWMH